MADQNADSTLFVCEGWWHPNVKSGQVHDHPDQPKGNWSVTMHRLCEQVYTRREPRQNDSSRSEAV